MRIIQTIWFKSLLIIVLIIILISLLEIKQDNIKLQSLVQTQSQIKPIVTKDLPQFNNSEEIKKLYLETISTLPAHDYYCIPQKKSYCDQEGCKEVESNIFNLVGNHDKSKSTDDIFLARCDKKSCDTYDVNASLSGIYMNFSPKEPNGMIFKMSANDSSYIEVATIGTDTFVSNGYCYANK